MGKFQQAIIHGNICAPNSPHFSLKEWEEKFEELGSDDVDDTIFSFGQMVSSQILHIHSKLAEQKDISKHDFLTFLSSTLNYNLIQIYIELESNFQTKDKKIATSYDFVDFVPIAIVGGGNIDAQVAIESLFLIIKISSSYIRQLTDSETKKSLNQLVTFLHNCSNVAVVTSFWSNILSGVYTYIRTNNSFIFINRNQEINKEIAKLRRSHNVIYDSHQALEESKSISLDVVGFDSSKGDLTVRRANNAELASLAGEQARSLLTLNLFYEERLNGFGDITLGDLWRVYISLGGLRHDLAEHYKTIGDISEPADIFKFHHAFFYISMIETLCQATNIAQEKVQLALQCFCFAFDKREDPAIKFFFPIEGLLIPVLPTMTPNFDFLLSSWLSLGKAKIDKKGAAFEKHIRDRLAGCTSEKALNLHVYTSAINFKAGKQKEEIDLAFILGEDLYICELKFFLYPADDMSYFVYRSKIEKAVAQVERKKNFISKNLQAFISKYFKPRAIKSIHSLVISGQFECSGEKINDTYIIDSSALLAFFATGKEEVHGAEGISPEIIQELGITLEYYKDKSEAAEKFIPYIDDLPQLSIFRKNMEIKTTTMYGTTPCEIVWYGSNGV